MYRSLRILVLVGLLLGAGLWAYKNLYFTPRKPNIILIVVDTTRADHLSMHGYSRLTTPFIDSFARQNLFFKNAIATSPWTPPSVASIFTGLYPSAHGVRYHVRKGKKKTRVATLPEQFVTLAEALKTNGYQTLGITANAWVADYLGFAQGFDSFTTIDYSPGERVTNEGIALLKKIAKKKEAPFFLYLHYMDPHAPYSPPPGFKGKFKGRLKNSRIPRKHHHIVNRYDGEIAYFDSEFQRLIQHLKSQDLYDDAVIALVSDHGEQFGEYGKVDHGFTLFQEEVHVPMVLKAGKQHGVVDHSVSILDLYPTILEHAQAPPLLYSQGFSLTSQLELRRQRGVLTEAPKIGNVKGYISPEGRKIIVSFKKAFKQNVDKKDIEKQIGMYATHLNASTDKKLTGGGKRQSDRLINKLLKIVRNSHKIRKDVEVKEKNIDLKPDTIEQLKGLGYLN